MNRIFRSTNISQYMCVKPKVGSLSSVEENKTLNRARRP